MLDINKFAKEWIFELLCDMHLIMQAEEDKNRNWDKAVEHAIELRAWREKYRKVSQLCHEIEGDVLDEFKKMFPEGIETYKSENNLYKQRKI